MTKQLKYRSKPVFWDLLDKRVISSLGVEKYRFKGKLKLPNHIERFDSTLEFNVYQKLIDLYGNRRIVTQYPLMIFPPGYCYPKGKYWRVDFAVKTAIGSNDYTRFVEAKGAVLSDFRHTLSALENHDERSFCKLRIVFGGGIPQDSAFVKNLLKTDFKRNLYSFKHFEKLTRLP